VGEVGNYKGQKKGIIILVNFSNVSFKSSNNNALFQSIANEENYTNANLGFKGSMRDYFYKQSDGQFELTFDVVGPYTVSNTQSYYGGNDSSGDDKYPATMVIEACQLAANDVNFADYDWDGDGEVDQVYVVYAGKGEADGGASSTIWPHEWTLDAANYFGDGSGPQTIDGVTINTYACGPELNGSTGKIAGIGTMCHEFSHCLGYPDFYDTDYSGGQGMGYWDLMDSGSYNGDGYQPAGYTSYERWVAGWKTPVELDKNTKVENMKSLQDGGDAYIIYNDNNNKEYFLLENRQFSGWDESLPGDGLLILHVDYDSLTWANNQPNDTPSRQRMTWIPADNEYQYETYNFTKYYSFEYMANDPFPYGSVNAFSQSTTPAAKFNNKTSNGTYYMDWEVNSITQNSDGTVSFVYKVPTAATLSFSPNPGVYTEAQTVSISCDEEDVTIYYTTDGSTPTVNSTVYTEPILIEASTTLSAIAVNADGEESNIYAARYIINNGGIGTSYVFRKVTSADDLVSGLRCVIACPSKEVAAGSLSNTYLTPAYDITVDNDNGLIVINDDVEVFTLDGSGNKYSFINADGKFLYPSASKTLAYGENAYQWSIAEEAGEIVMKHDTYGRMLYNASSPRFTVYTSSTNSAMILANLYVEYVEVPKQDVTLSYSEETANATVGKSFTAPTLNITPSGANITLSYSSSDTSVATVDASTGEVTPKGAGTTTITATFAGNFYYNAASASYTLNVNEDVELTFSASEVKTKLGYVAIAPSLTISPEADEIVVSYSSSDTDVAEVDETTGELTTKAIGTTTITATFEGTTYYNAATASYTLTVIDATTPLAATEGCYQIVTSSADLESGKNYLIVAKDYNVAYNGIDVNKGLTGYVKPDEDGIIDLMSNADFEVVPVVLTFDKDTCTIFDTVAEAYIGVYSSTNGKYSKYITSGTTASTVYFKWNVSIGTDSVATVKSYGKDYYLRYNSTSTMFRVYSSGQDDICLYKEMEVAPAISTGISTVKQNMVEGIYDLTGRRVSEGRLKKGVYIINGKKVVR
ncbi:MAG: M6 family metalloprotease domain-containing protein, partial [Prevotella sp.]|nr:M6 family metalloprotease domain-containing protein [Prevotella sp.]